MTQPSVASYFNTRKRPATEDIHLSKNKVFVATDPSCSSFTNPAQRLIFNNEHCDSQTQLQPENAAPVLKETKTRSGRVIKRIGVANVEESENLKQQKLVKFIKKGNLSPRKRLTPKKQDVSVAFTSKVNLTNVDRGMKTPVKQITTATVANDLQQLVNRELSFDEVKTKVSRSAKLQELKASLNRIQELEKIRKAQEDKNKRLRNGTSTSKEVNSLALKEFKTIELEILTSPDKGFKTPTKVVPPAPDKNELMSPKSTATPKRILFSPSKDGSPAKVVAPPAYQRFMNLASSVQTTLPMPFKYRSLVELFKCLDSVCAMFHNRKEIITFKKLKPAVQRMLRKNLNESHLAQIKYLYPEAFTFTQMKMRNYGSISKQDYFQLVIAPNVEGVVNGHLTKIDEDNVLKSAQTYAMNPQVMTDRYQKFQNILLNKVKDEHDKFLKSLDPPLVIHQDKITRWHPEFDLENCPNIEEAHLPQPPNVEKYSSAKDILSTARNLFNCATPMERAMERLKAKTEADQKESLANPNVDTCEKSATVINPTETILKNVPKSLLEKIRAKQAAKALDAITRRPSQDQEATKYSRLPELARHLRNVFVSEKKGVLPLEIVIKKIENSFRTCLTPKDIEQHLQLISKECPCWIVFHEIRKTVYLKMFKDIDLAKIIDKLEKAANEKSK